MSRQLISRNQDLSQLRDEGYELEVRAGYLLVKSVPYLNSRREVKHGTLVSELTLAIGDVTATPGSHQAYFIGEHPCHADGSKITQIEHGGRHQFDQDLVVDHSFSAKPAGGYANYYQKVTVYVSIISGPARQLDCNATAQTHAWAPLDEPQGVFKFADSASSRAKITGITRKLEQRKLAIVGLGGTGGYVLDLVAKTPVAEIHLFDGDVFLQHNAFRAPGTPGPQLFGAPAPKKVDYFQSIYARMREGIIPHPYYLDASNVDALRNMEFVFLCMDGTDEKRVLVERLESFGIPFIDAGMGVERVEDALRGILRVTTSTPTHREHFRKRVALSQVPGEDDYPRNIQIADLNALNAALAVIKWKKLRGFYVDLDEEHHSTYTIDGNMLLNGDAPCAQE